MVATPLGNLSDITLRAIDTLRQADLIAAEDTRVTATLLAAHGIATRMIAAHAHNEARAAERIAAEVALGRQVALVSDAGTPGVSDPGARIVAAVRAAGHAVIPIPGPSAAITALSASGFDGPFHFAGFLPTRATVRRETLAALAALPAHVVLYEAPHRIATLAADIAATCEHSRRVLVARELTKRFETIATVPAGELGTWVAADPNRARGELVVIIERGATPEAGIAEGERVLTLLLAELPAARAAKLAAAITGASREALYQRALALREKKTA